VLLNLEELGIQDESNGILLAIDRAHLECGEELSKGHRCRHRSEELERLNMRGIRCGAYLQALEILRRAHWPAVVG